MRIPDEQTDHQDEYRHDVNLGRVDPHRELLGTKWQHVRRENIMVDKLDVVADHRSAVVEHEHTFA